MSSGQRIYRSGETWEDSQSLLKGRWQTIIRFFFTSSFWAKHVRRRAFILKFRWRDQALTLETGYRRFDFPRNLVLIEQIKLDGDEKRLEADNRYHLLTCSSRSVDCSVKEVRVAMPSLCRIRSLIVAVVAGGWGAGVMERGFAL